MSYRFKKKLSKIFLVYLPLIPILSFILFPFYWCVITAFKPDSEIISRTVTYFPQDFTFEHFIYAWNNVGFFRYFLNSLFVSVLVLIGCLVLSVLVAYPLTRFQFKGKRAVSLILLCSQFLPMAMMVIPLFMTFKSMGLIDSLFSVVLASLAFRLPFISLMMLGYMQDVPIEIEESAMIDGCNRMQGIIRVVLPILRPGMIAVGAFAFIYAWKEYLFTTMFINTPAKMTLSVGLSSMMGEYSIAYGLLAAGCTIAMVVPILIFAYFQKFLVQGIASGAVKG
ncbi:MAG: carbohydrate ABC transporter permease [Ruthenibacterium sp.]